ncbi:FAD/NAD(P)-binding protein [Lichenifustis flavocetrariae]|uniref:FAD/NAD(P)-binding protein n=1 Tax=Lichenifustis flavocetrariae TaxID=2949735 RepID=A0AA42CKR8_9HYPH|nr:FAD/NAD(P)-binding protein [Lichenifustis flavocetrariae]MCW6506575.1 FAD/NAD(P)-binding protein [Lichenifustis flavocetrariae]
MSAVEQRSPRLVVIGGGLTGAAAIVHSARAATGPLVIDVVEPGAEIGRGIAYGTVDPAHRINVPTDRMSLFPDDPDHLTRWLFAHGVLPDRTSTDGNGHHYVPRSAYGDYVTDTLRQTLAASPLVRFRHHRRRAAAIRAEGSGWAVDLSDGGCIDADGVLLCCGHAPPSRPSHVSQEAAYHPGYIANPWAQAAFASIGSRDNVLVVGTGLTMADVIASLDRQAHEGSLTAISRRGLLARPQGLFLSDIAFLDRDAPPTALALLRMTRRRVRELGPAIGWQPVIDALRYDLPEVWGALPPREQQRVARRLLPFWEVHRFRLAPQIHELLDREIGRRRLTIETAGLERLEVRDGRLAATIQPRSAAHETRCYDHVVLCTGPGKRLEADPLLKGLIERGLAQPDAVSLGIAVDCDSRVISSKGAAQTSFWALGPLTRGSFGEMTGAPDIIRHITRIAPLLARVPSSRLVQLQPS